MKKFTAFVMALIMSTAMFLQAVPIYALTDENLQQTMGSSDTVDTENSDNNESAVVDENVEPQEEQTGTIENEISSLEDIEIGDVEADTGIVTGNIVDSGSCGENVSWALHGDGRLVISGEGEMDGYSGSDGAPWYEYRNLISSVIVEEGVEVIGFGSFDGLEYVTEVSIPSSVWDIPTGAFKTCISLEKIFVGDNNGNYESYNGMLWNTRIIELLRISKMEQSS